jgi:hypothetical protein
MAGLLLHAIEHISDRISARRVDYRHDVAALEAAPRLADPHSEICADAETVFHLMRIRPLLEAQASDVSNDSIVESADVASISLRGSDRYT